MAGLVINHVNKLGSVRVGGDNPTRIMGILNTSPESFYKDSVKQTRQAIAGTVRQMEQEGADIIDVGGMSTAPYLKTVISEKEESRRIAGAIKTIQNVSNLPISVDTCRASVAKNALDLGVRILNDISGLKYDDNMPGVVSSYGPSLVLCAFGRGGIADGEPVRQTKGLLRQSVILAEKSGISPDNVVLDPSIGFFRRSGSGKFFTKTTASDWFGRDLKIIQNLKRIGQGHPLLVSVSNKSLIGKLFDIENPADRVAGSTVVEAICVLNGANVIRTHNVGQTKQAVSAAEKISKLHKGL